MTNSVRHARLEPGASVGLKVSISPAVVRVEVTDPGAGFEPKATSPSLYQSSGWGLFFVGQIAARWGVIRGPGSLVWFEIDRADPRLDEQGSRSRTTAVAN